MPHHRTPAEIAALHERIVQLRRERLDANTIAERVGVTASNVGVVIRAAIARGEDVPVLRQPKQPKRKRGGMRDSEWGYRGSM